MPARSPSIATTVGGSAALDWLYTALLCCLLLIVPVLVRCIAMLAPGAGAVVLVWLIFLGRCSAVLPSTNCTRQVLLCSIWLIGFWLLHRCAVFDWFYCMWQMMAVITCMLQVRCYAVPCLIVHNKRAAMLFLDKLFGTGALLCWPMVERSSFSPSGVIYLSNPKRRSQPETYPWRVSGVFF